MELLDVLSAVSVENRDDGKRFTKPGRLERIGELLWNTGYRRVNADGLFHLYALHPIRHYAGTPVTIASCHVDCHPGIARVFEERVSDQMLKGTFDNSITNAALLYLMLNDRLPDGVLAAFTGDEEFDSAGAADLIRFLKANGIEADHIYVLDVTNVGWEDGVDFTVENDFWQGDCGRPIIKASAALPYNWRFVPSEPSSVPPFVPAKNVIRMEAEPDESWFYDDEDANCCSICLPVYGEMHRPQGVLARMSSFERYTEALCAILKSRL